MIEQMEQLLLIIFIAVVGLQLGSFAGASVWRLRARQLSEDKADGEEYDKAEYQVLKKLMKTSVRSDRSRCLHCSHQLAWYDLIPIVSWLSLRGKCRYCHKSIGRFELLIESGVMALFVISFIFWPMELNTTYALLQFGIWLTASVGLVMLFVYDAKWFLLPNVVVFPLIALAMISAGMTIVSSNDMLGALMSVIGSGLILSGLYYILYVVSRGEWIGFGDIKLGLVLALLLADWKLALLALFMANLIGCIVILPAMIAKKIQRTTHVPFGPMLISAFFIVSLFGVDILSWYTRSFVYF